MGNPSAIARAAHAAAASFPLCPDDLPARVRQLLPLIERLAPVNERQGALDAELISALHAVGAFGMWVPRTHGGLELSPTRSLDLIEEVAYADGSTAWVLMAASLSTGTGAAFLERDIVDRYFAGSRFSIIAGQGGPMGRAVACPGGYSLSGHWTYGSGIKHADYLHTGALVFEADGTPRMDARGGQEMRIFVAPIGQFELIDNWDVMGLRATGSIDYRTDGVFVPEGATHLTDCNEPRQGGILFTLGIRGLSSLGHTGFTLGLGRRILDEVAIIAQSKANRLGRLGDNPSFLEKYGDAEAKLRAARALARETWVDVEATLDRGEALSTRQWTLVRLALNHVTWTTAEIANTAFYAAGGNALRAGTLQRCFRDMHGATQHLTSSLSVLQDCGRELSGVLPGARWGFTRLLDAVQ
jgi:alkylation response protein AidB-like acyl-CoA dehydrogenase